LAKIGIICRGAISHSSLAWTAASIVLCIGHSDAGTLKHRVIEMSGNGMLE